MSLNMLTPIWGAEGNPDIAMSQMGVCLSSSSKNLQLYVCSCTSRHYAAKIKQQRYKKGRGEKDWFCSNCSFLGLIFPCRDSYLMMCNLTFQASYNKSPTVYFFPRPVDSLLTSFLFFSFFFLEKLHFKSKENLEWCGMGTELGDMGKWSLSLLLYFANMIP